MTLENKHYVIISAHRSEYSKTENAIASSNLIHDLLNLVGFDAPVVPVSGRYKGVPEQSYAVIMPSFIDDYRAYSRIQDGLVELGFKYK